MRGNIEARFSYEPVGGIGTKTYRTCSVGFVELV